MELTRRSFAKALGLALILLEIPDVAYVLWYRVPFVTHLLAFAAFVGLGSALLWWGGQAPAPRREGTPSLFWTVAAMVIGCLFLLYASLLGFVLNFVLSPGQALESALVPWGLVGAFLLGYGSYRLADSIRLGLAREQAARVLSGAAGLEASLRGQSSARPVPPETLVRIRMDIVTSVEQLLSATSRSVVSILLGTLFINVFAILFGVLLIPFGPQLAPAGTPILPYVPVGASLIVLGSIGSAVSWSRIRGFRDATTRLASGEVPEDWMLGYWGGLRATVRFFLSPFGGVPSTGPREGESSVLAESLALLRFGRRLAYNARAAYITFFLLILIIGPAGILLGALAIGSHVSPGAPDVPLEALIEWGGVLALLVADFLYLFLQLRVVDNVSRQLQTLQAAEAEIVRAFWSRY